jgi:hypothetical protein
MNREAQNFDQLRRLLRLKRYEQPPPRYFNEFSIQVVARLRAGQGSGLADGWLQRLWSALELRPVVPAAFGAAICGLLVVGAVYTEEADMPQGFNPTSGENGAGPIVATTAPVPLSHAPDYTLTSFSTNPVPAGSLFDQIPLGLQPPARVSQPFMK